MLTKQRTVGQEPTTTCLLLGQGKYKQQSSIYTQALYLVPQSKPQVMMGLFTQCVRRARLGNQSAAAECDNGFCVWPSAQPRIYDCYVISNIVSTLQHYVGGITKRTRLLVFSFIFRGRRRDRFTCTMMRRRARRKMLWGVRETTLSGKCSVCLAYKWRAWHWPYLAIHQQLWVKSHRWHGWDRIVTGPISRKGQDCHGANFKKRTGLRIWEN